MAIMKPCVLYFSLTGNTKRFAEAISELIEAPAFDITSCEPSTVTDYDLLIIGTPVMGMQPAPIVSTFVKRLPQGYGKKAIVFCTYAIAKGGVLKGLERELAAKGYLTILSVGKRGVKPNKVDFKDVLAKVSRAVEEQKRS
jgi:flavodoxin